MKQIVGCSFLALVMALPALDFFLVMRIVYVATVPDLLSPFLALLTGFLLAIVVCVVFILGQGNTLVELVVPCLILLFLLLILYPVALRFPETRRANLQKRALQRRGSTPQKGTQ